MRIDTDVGYLLQEIGSRLDVGILNILSIEILEAL